MAHIGRRGFIGLLGGAAAWPLTARAQQPAAIRRIGVLLGAYTAGDRAGQARIAVFLDSLRALGWSEAGGIRIDYRWGNGDIARIREEAGALVQTAPDAILVAGDPALAAVHRLSTAIPIVFTQVSEPVDSGFVASLARPGGTITGFQNFEPAMGGKWLGMLKEIAPEVRRIGALFVPGTAPHAAFLRAAEAVAPALGLAVTALTIRSRDDIEDAIATFAGQAHSGLIVLPHPHTIANRAAIHALAIRHRLPAIYPYRYFATDGGLVSYGPDQIDQWRGAAMYVDRILRGETPGELPIQAPVRYELAVNLRTAAAIGLAVPPTLLARADAVIE
jgi:putative ABC transport system substrate-binding protein